MAEEVNKPKEEQMVVEAEQLVVKTDELVVKTENVMDDAVPVDKPAPSVDTEQTVVTKERTPEAETTTTSVTTTKPIIQQGLVIQPTAMPTNKHMAYTGGIMFGILVNVIVDAVWPELLPVQFWALFPPFIGWVAGYYMKDQRNA